MQEHPVQEEEVTLCVKRPNEKHGASLCVPKPL